MERCSESGDRPTRPGISKKNKKNRIVIIKEKYIILYIISIINHSNVQNINNVRLVPKFIS